MALIDLHFADKKAVDSYNCNICKRNPANAQARRCEEPGFDNLKKPRKVDDRSLEYRFCPGKATWYPEIYELFYQCRVALETGIMPNRGSFIEQDEMFVDVFPFFVDRWKERFYGRIWKDTQEYVKSILEALFKKK